MSDLFWSFDKSEPGYVVRKIHKESDFSVGFDLKFHFLLQNDVKGLDDFRLIWRNSMIWLNPKAYHSIWHMHHKIQVSSFILIYNMRPEIEPILCLRGLKIQNKEPFIYFEQKVYIQIYFRKARWIEKFRFYNNSYRLNSTKRNGF